MLKFIERSGHVEANEQASFAIYYGKDNAHYCGKGIIVDT